MSDNIGLLGGTFNPPHFGHIGLGREVLQHFPVHSIRFVLSAFPPHKSGSHIVDPSVRFLLLQQALSPYDKFYADQSELKRASPSWTYTTVVDLKKNFPDTSFFFVCGSEAFLAIRTWFEYQSLLDMIGFLVFLRSPSHYQSLVQLCHEEKIGIHPSPPVLPAAREVTLFSVSCETLLFSSSEIRKKIRNKEQFEYMLPDPVVKIIKEKKLYV